MNMRPPVIDVVAVEPRLIGLKGSARYLGISDWTLRALIADGHLRPVRLPSVRDKNENGRRILLDRRDLDAFIDARRQA